MSIHNFELQKKKATNLMNTHNFEQEVHKGFYFTNVKTKFSKILF